jgi:4-diphosphocytidyl-2-C-methyl-D-erythritol kinase
VTHEGRARALAPAKVNLFLHVGPPGADGYHPLASLAVFADVGDDVTVERAADFRVETVGPFAGAIEGGSNLVETALTALAREVGLERLPLNVRLDKHLPVAAGLGGGSSDAAVAMKLARDVLRLGLDDDALGGIAAPLGADMAMCLKGRAVMAGGKGERLSPAPCLPQVHAVLANPGVPSATGPVYRAYDAAPRAELDAPVTPGSFDSVEALAAWLRTTRNDLAEPAISLQPMIGEALAAMSGAEDVRLARVTGSGATVFGLFGAAAAACHATESLKRANPGWWVRACRLA